MLRSIWGKFKRVVEIISALVAVAMAGFICSEDPMKFVIMYGIVVAGGVIAALALRLGPCLAWLWEFFERRCEEGFPPPKPPEEPPPGVFQFRFKNYQKNHLN